MLTLPQKKRLKQLVEDGDCVGLLRLVQENPGWPQTNWSRLLVIQPSKKHDGCKHHAWNAVDETARRGAIAMLRLLLEHRCIFTKHTYSSAVIGGHLRCLRFLHEEAHCPWDEDACSWAAERGELACLQYLHENGCPWDYRACLNAAETGRLPCVQYAHEQGCPWGPDCNYTAAFCSLACDRLAILKYACEHGCPNGANTCERAAACNAIKCLKYLHEQRKCQWDKRTTKAAAGDGSLECLQYAIEHGCPWDEVQCLEAAAQHDNVRKWIVARLAAPRHSSPK